jgi:hypothetical protein
MGVRFIEKDEARCGDVRSDDAENEWMQVLYNV